MLTDEGIVGQECLHLFLKHGNGGGLRGGNVPGFSGVGFKIVQLWHGRLDKVETLTFERVQRTPTERTEGIKSLAVGRIFCSLTRLLTRAQQRTRLKLRRNRADRITRILHAGQLEKRRRHSRRLHGLALPSSIYAAPSRRVHGPRHVHGRVVNEESMLIVAVSPEGFAELAERDD